MKVRFESVVDGVNRYLNQELYKNLNGPQEFLARLIVGRVNQNAESIKQNLMSNGFIRTLGFVDSEGMIEIDQLLQDVKRELERQGSVQMEIPYLGKITFRPEDVEVLRNEITGR